ncbi:MULTISPECIES: calcium-binding protein [Kamptonema]|uniref:calcium-binding protein n=1 Tax=Kamptonema TaxID=1501433 RepID=UPI0001DAC256|nr:MULTISPECIES: calcium-binding protein [Kamptonema]CBN54836.1 putative Hemolysin-type calcium-binding region [Kamptonema sp. PCC 6506]
MTQVTNPTQPASSTPNAQGGLDIVGVAGDNRLSGSSGSDSIQTFGGNDLINAGAGNDYAATSTGSDTVVAGSGNDTVYGGKGNDVVDGGDGNDFVVGGFGGDTLSGGGGDDVIYADDLGRPGNISGGADNLSCGTGSDRAFGLVGEDIISGDDGNDTVYGGKGGDTINGGAGNDFLAGDRGADILTGGTGNDTFAFTAQATGTGIDTITDFTPAEDKIALAKAAFGGLGGTFDPTEFVVQANFNPNAPGSTANKVIYDPNSGLLYYNTGNGVQALAQLQGGLTITSSNFELF